MILLDLFVGFFYVGCFAFGGGYGAIPLIRDVVLSHGWLEDEMLTNVIAISESTPGPIMVNLATYVGSCQAGLAGAMLATIAVVLPSFLIVLLILALLKNLLHISYVQAVLRGLKACMVGIVLATGVYTLYRNGIVFQAGKLQGVSVILTVFLGTAYFGSKKLRKGGISPILLICLSALAGVAVYGT